MDSLKKNLTLPKIGLLIVEYGWIAPATRLGFQGFGNECKKLLMGHKRKRVKKGQSNELSMEQKAHNKVVNSERVVVEHSLAGLKRYRILVNRNRLKVTGLLNRLLGVCAGLWNLTIS